MALKSDRTSPIATVESEKKAENRTSPVYFVSDGQLALEDVTKPRPDDYDKQIDISWIENALEQKSFEEKYSAWDLIESPAYNISCSCFGNGISVAASPSGKLLITSNHGNSFEEKDIISNITCITFLNYIESKVLDDGRIIETNINKFMLFSSDGKCIYTTDNFATTNELNIINDSYIDVCYSNGRIILLSNTGKMYISNDYGLNFNELVHNYNIKFTGISCDNKGFIMACGNAGAAPFIYSFDNGITWKSIDNIPLNQYVDIVCGESKCIACSIDGASRLIVFDYNIETQEISYQLISLKKEYTLLSLSYGARIFTVCSSDGSILSSYDGNRWVEVPCGNGSWCHILRTDKFFIVFSSSNSEDGLNAVRSSNGGLLSIHFATVDEIIDNEKSNLSIDIQGVNGWFNWLEKVRGITAFQVRRVIVDENSSFTDTSELTEPSIYLVTKSLLNLPEPEAHEYEIEVFNIKSKDDVIQGCFQIATLKENGINSKYYQYVRTATYSDEVYTFSDWHKCILDLSYNGFSVVSKSTVISASATFLVEDINGTVSKIDNIDLSDEKISVSKSTVISSSATFLVEDINGTVSKIDNIDLSDEKISVSKSTVISSSATFLVEDINGTVSKIDNIDLSDEKISVSKSTVISSSATFLVEDINGTVSKIDNIDLSNEKITVSKSIVNTAVNTLLVTDENGSINNIPFADFKPFNSFKSDSINYKYIDDTSPVTDYNELVEDGFYIISKNLTNAPFDLTNTGYSILLVVKKMKVNNVTALLQESYKLGYGFLRSYSSYYFRLFDFSTNEWSPFEKFYCIDLSGESVTLSKNTDLKNMKSLLCVGNNGIINETYESNKFSFINFLDIADFINLFDLTYPVTMQQLYDTLKYKNFSFTVIGIESGSSKFSDIPRDYAKYTGIFICDGHGNLTIELIGNNSLSKYYSYSLNGVMKEFKKITNEDGSININLDNIILEYIKSNPAEIRKALGLGTLATKNQINLADTTQVTGVLKAANGGFNYADFV